jgi:hypothetical protein
MSHLTRRLAHQRSNLAFYLQQQFRNEPPQPVVSLVLAQEWCSLNPKQSIGDRLGEDAHTRAIRSSIALRGAKAPLSH